MEIKLGRTYRDKITGIEGVCYGISRSYNSSDRVVLWYKHDGQVVEAWFDVDLLEHVETTTDIVITNNMQNSSDIVLGKKYQYTIQKLEGTVLAVVDYLTGCSKVALEYLFQGDIKTQWVSVGDLKPLFKKEPKKICKKSPGGPELICKRTYR